TTSPMLHQAVAVEHGVHRADRWQVGSRQLLPQLFADLRRAPAGILALQPHDRRLDRRRQPIGLAVRPPTAIRERAHATILVAVVNLVAGLPRDPELGA